MAEIVGTITNLSDFLSKTQVCLSVKPNDPQQQIICLEADRKYSIPAFQREVRWDDNNLKMLLYDLSRSSKFLGNIILTIKSDHTCEIIDGQQRTTVLMLIVSCIKKKFGTKISTPDLCPLRNEGFTGFQTLLEKAFDQEAITSDDWNAILKSDDYLQLPRIQKLWNTISSSELLADRHKAQGLLDNLCKSEFNIIASYSNDVNTSIQYFLDVNLKGIRLDTEDIFKGYLFSQDTVLNEFEHPLSQLYTDWLSRDTDEMDAFRDSIACCADDILRKRVEEKYRDPAQPIYPNTRSEAIARGEVFEWMASRDRTLTCAGTFEKDATNAYNDGKLSAFLKEWTNTYGKDRCMFVLACTMRQRTGDERFYPPARQAADRFAALQKQMGGHTDVYAVDNHSCVINAAMEQLAKPERSKEKPVAQRKQSEPER